MPFLSCFRSSSFFSRSLSLSLSLALFLFVFVFLLPLYLCLPLPLCYTISCYTIFFKCSVILYYILYTIYYILYTIYSILYTLYSILYTLYSILYTLYCAILYFTLLYYPLSLSVSVPLRLPEADVLALQAMKRQRSTPFLGMLLLLLGLHIDIRILDIRYWTLNIRYRYSCQIQIRL